MAYDLVRMVPDVRVPQTGYDGSSGTTIYEAPFSSEDNAVQWKILFGAGAPTSLDDAPLGSLYVDLTNYKLYIHTATSTWTVVGAQS